jgi:hypothetical protein
LLVAHVLSPLCIGQTPNVAASSRELPCRLSTLWGVGLFRSAWSFNSETALLCRSLVSGIPSARADWNHLPARAFHEPRGDLRRPLESGSPARNVM